MEIKLRKKALVALIDERDTHLAQHSWSWHNYLGVVRYDKTRYDPEKQHTPHVLLHREISKAKYEDFIMHINGNRLDNRRKNLLLLPKRYRAQYSQKKAKGKSPYFGVTVKKSGFQVYCGGEYIGKFHDEIEAARAYDDTAWTKYGAAAKVNFPRDWEVCEECFSAHFVGQQCQCQKKKESIK